VGGGHRRPRPLTPGGPPPRAALSTDLNAYLRIGEDGRVTVFSGKIEMGQGIHTSLAQMAAEELGVGLDVIEMVLGDTDRCPFDAGTWGSLTTRMFGPALRTAAAEARLVLVRLASEQLGVPTEQLVVESGIVSVKGESARKVSLRCASRRPRIADGGRQGGAAGRGRVHGHGPLAPEG
jgi:isoquinoline 1-oxidoreductase